MTSRLANALAIAWPLRCLLDVRSLLRTHRIDEARENGGLQRQATSVCGYLELQSIPAALADEVVSLQELLA